MFGKLLKVFGRSGQGCDRGVGDSISGEIEWSAAVLQALDSLRLKLSNGTSAREAEAAKALDEYLSRMREGKSIDHSFCEYPGLRKLLELMLHTAQPMSNAPGVSPSDQFRAESRARIETMPREGAMRARVTDARQERRVPGVLGNAWMTLVYACTSRRVQGAAIALAMIVAIGASFLSVGTITNLSQDSDLASKCTLSVLGGEVEVSGPGSDTWRLAADGAIVEAGFRVKTAADSYAVLTFFEGSTVKLEPNTDIEIQRVESTDSGGTVIALRQWVGKTWSRVVKMVDPGSSYEIETPSAIALVRGTLFETEVGRDASTTVRTTEGLVSVVAQGEEVCLPLGQEASVDLGAPPSEPQTMNLSENQLVVIVDMPAVASICDPTGSSTGHLPSGMGFNQILGSRSTSPSEGTQVINIPDPVPGDYSLVLRCVADGTAGFVLEGLSRGQEAFTYAGACEMVDGSGWLVTFHLEVEDNRFFLGNVDGPELLDGEPPEIIVVADQIAAMLIPIESLNTGIDSSIARQPDGVGIPENVQVPDDPGQASDDSASNAPDDSTGQVPDDPGQASDDSASNVPDDSTGQVPDDPGQEPDGPPGDGQDGGKKPT
ncbi:MAG: FecR domain-containing protein [Dehalococcoidia bacterium]|nr:FecR domain-containing protein [Dehalococcoidia bacterium]